MMKIILGFIAFIVTFGFSTTLVGLLFGFPQPSQANYLTVRSNSTTAQRIERLLKRDVRNGQMRHRVARELYQSGETENSLYSSSEYRETIASYVRKSSNMNDAGLPRDFQYAWRNHMKAWNKQAAFVKNFGTANGYDPNAFSVRGYGDNTREINQTWDQVLRIAQRYGVKIDRSYYR